MAEEKIRVPAEVCSYFDDNNQNLNLEISIPGVNKDNIDLKMKDDSFSLTAPRDEIEYATTWSFCCPVDSKAAKAKYENGLLKISVPFKDTMADAVRISVS